MYTDLVDYKQIQRDYFSRMNPQKSEVMKISKEYDKDFWDGDRKYGYGGYKYDGRWKFVAEKLRLKYKLNDNSKILDVGAGKGYLLKDLYDLNPTYDLYGIEISRYAVDCGNKEFNVNWLQVGNAIDLPWKDNYFDLVISLGTLHNLKIYDLKKAIHEIERIGKKKYITMESFRNDKERINLFCWAQTAESYFSDKEWEWILNEFGYTGDYSLFFFE